VLPEKWHRFSDEKHEEIESASGKVGPGLSLRSTIETYPTPKP